MEEIANLNNVNALPFNRQHWLGYHSLKAANATLVPAPIGLIGNEQDAVLQMAVEFTDHLVAAGDLERMRAENPLQASNQCALAAALAADQHHRSLSLAGLFFDCP